jgi:hypothetical protein
MKSRESVYKLEKILDDPRYEGFGTDPPGSFPNSIPPGRTSREWKVRRLRRNWAPVPVIGRVREFNDYPCVGLSHPALSRRAVEALREFLEPNGEILPLSSKLGSYYHYNVLTVADVLDRKRSEIRWNPKPITASDIERYEFDAKKLDGLSIFRLVEQPARIFVNEAFAARARESRLRGLNFIKVWPLPAGVHWRQLARAEERRQKSKGLPKGQTVKGNTVIIRLSLADPKSKGNKAEKRAINRLMDQLDALLVDADSDRPAVGNLEGHDDGVAGECRLFLSCPDADALVEKLRPWLKDLSWPKGFSVRKRYGEYVDKAAPEEDALI